MFDWQTEEDDKLWEEPAPQQKPQREKLTAKWWWLAIPLIAIAAGLLVYRQVQQEARDRLALVEQDIASSQSLFFEAVANQDEDLLKVLLSGRDIEWVIALQALVDAGAAQDYAPFNLTYQPDSHELGAVELSPELDYAEMTFTQSYRSGSLLAEEQEVVLVQTAVFRRGTSRWLIAPREADFWGGWQTRTIEDTTLVFPEQDELFMDTLTSELRDWLPRFCQELPDFPCDPWQKNIRFETDPAARLALVQNPRALYTNQLQLALPAPSLIGLPVDAAGERVLLDAYKSLIGRAYIADMVGYECCRRLLIFDALASYQLTQLGLYQWPVTIDTHFAAWEEEQATVTQLPTLWSTEETMSAGEDQLNLLLLLDFAIQTAPNISVVQMQRLLNESELTSSGWLNELFAENNDALFIFNGNSSGQLLDRWRSYTYLNHNAARQFIDGMVPEQAVLLACQTRVEGFPTTTAVYQYTATNGQWRTIDEINRFGLILPFADDSQLLFETVPFDDVVLSNRLEVWTPNGSKQQVSLFENAYNLSLGQMSPNGRFVTAYNFNANPNNLGPQTVLFDMDSCTPNGCEQFNLIGTPYWSGNGQMALIQEFNDFDFLGQLPDGRIFGIPSVTNYQLHLAETAQLKDRTAYIELSSGYAPFWLDAERYGYVFWNQNEATWELHIADIASESDRIVLTSAALRSSAPADIRSRHWVIGYALPLQDQQTLAVIGVDQDNVSHLFLFDLPAQRLRYLTSLDDALSHQLALSPNGRYLAASTLVNPSNPISRDLKLIDLKTYDIQRYPLGEPVGFAFIGFDWSLDSEWLAVKANLGTVQLIHPQTGQRTLIEHPDSTCGNIAWLEPFE